MKKEYVGVNIQFPISQDLLLGKKTVETRTYPLPSKYVGEEMLLVETPGKEGIFKARIVAIVVFKESFKYRSSKDFYADIDRHKVDKKSKWAWQSAKPKWGWVVDKIKVLPKPKEVKGIKGIVFTKHLNLEP